MNAYRRLCSPREEFDLARYLVNAGALEAGL